MEAKDGLRVAVRRTGFDVAMARLWIVTAIPFIVLSCVLGTFDRWSRWVVAYWLVALAKELHDTLRPVAVVDEGGITFVEGWGTRRVGFGDVLEWETDASGARMVLATHDGSVSRVNLSQVREAERKRVLIHMIRRLPARSVRERGRAERRGLGHRILADVAWYAVFLLASLHVVDGWNGWRDGGAPASFSPTKAVASEPQYGPRAEFYAISPVPRVELPLVFDAPHNDPWQFSNCHIEALAGMCAVRDG